MRPSTVSVALVGGAMAVPFWPFTSTASTGLSLVDDKGVDTVAPVLEQVDHKAGQLDARADKSAAVEQFEETTDLLKDLPITDLVSKAKEITDELTALVVQLVEKIESVITKNSPNARENVAEIQKAAAALQDRIPAFQATMVTLARQGDLSEVPVDQVAELKSSIDAVKTSASPTILSAVAPKVKGDIFSNALDTVVDALSQVLGFVAGEIYKAEGFEESDLSAIVPK
jgi:uncharacterized protein Yka (UPF0111/DUF47 family)